MGPSGEEWRGPAGLALQGPGRPAQGPEALFTAVESSTPIPGGNGEPPKGPSSLLCSWGRQSNPKPQLEEVGRTRGMCLVKRKSVPVTGVAAESTGRLLCVDPQVSAVVSEKMGEPALPGWGNLSGLLRKLPLQSVLTGREPSQRRSDSNQIRSRTAQRTATAGALLSLAPSNARNHCSN